ncbi:MAG: TonB-dependent receptor [Bacteroidota bacterium]
MRITKLLGALLLLLIPVTGAMAQSGKIAGTVRDASTGEALPGVNVVIDGTTQGAVTDLNGFYNILNVRPGTYGVRASFVGYTSQLVENVTVNTGLTSSLDFSLGEQEVGLDEVVVTAEAPIVELDVSANVANLSSEDFEDLPIASINDVLELQAGVEPGLEIRGGGLGEVAFIVDGMNLRTGRNNEPFTNISYTSVEAVQVQTGGFNAEYGNVRSGIVNVATKDPSRDKYTFDGLFRFRPAQEKARGGLPEDFDSYYIRPALDPQTNLDGTAAGWDIYTQRQYNDFTGWNNIVDRLNTEGFDVNVQDMVDYFNFTHRKDNEIASPDYEADFTFGGPIPFISDKLGDLRFLASYRNTQTAYIYPQTRDAYKDETFSAKLTSNIAPGMKLTLNAMSARERGMNRNDGGGGFFEGQADPYRGALPSYPWDNIGVVYVSGLGRRGISFSDAKVNRANIDHTMFGGEFVHTLNQNTFYEVTANYINSKYRTPFANLRDGSFLDENGNLIAVTATDNFGRVVNQEFVQQCFGGTTDTNGDGELLSYCVGEEPFGYSGIGGNLLGLGETTGGHWNKARDTSDVSVFTGRFDLTSQVNRFLQIKTGAEVIVSNYDMRFAHVNLELVGPEPESAFPYNEAPIQGAAYAQGKLEFGGMIANLGVRLDYFDANTEWWNFDPFDPILRSRVEVIDEVIPREAVDAQLEVSPRVGISFPITDNSKLYFNYGHFRQMLLARDIFGIEQSLSGGIDRIGNPNHPLPKTVAYELGYDQNFFDQFLFRVSGFYRDVRNQTRAVFYEDLREIVGYNLAQPWNYEDIRGAEFTITKNRGRWLRGFVNYTFLTKKDGNFGFGRFDENQSQQRDYLRTSTDFRINAPVAEPFARMNLQFLTPADFGGSSSGILGNWRVNLLGEWRKGQSFIWGGGGATPPELNENVRYRDFWNFDLRFTKHINTNFGNAQVFLDVANVFNLRHLYRFAAFSPDNRDFEQYMWSLHLPGDIYDGLNNPEQKPYIWIPGDDQPGDFRHPSVEFQPIEEVASLSSAADPNSVAWYWAEDTGDYSRWNGSAWEAVPDGELQKALDDKAYIDMPNFRFNTFLNPRAVSFGLRLSF